MALATLAGLGTGALHAVSGPDHVLALAPLSLGAGGRAWRIGLRWGVGHALGTIALWVALTMVARPLGALLTPEAGDRIAGAALVLMGGAALWRLRRGLAAVHAHAARGPALATGLVHGVAGGAAVLLLLPSVGNGALGLA